MVIKKNVSPEPTKHFLDIMECYQLTLNSKLYTLCISTSLERQKKNLVNVFEVSRIYCSFVLDDFILHCAGVVSVPLFLACMCHIKSLYIPTSHIIQLANSRRSPLSSEPLYWALLSLWLPLAKTCVNSGG